ncbi:MAG: cupin domain-containing protein [Pseudorhodoplanes sp.]|uniref:cupin domain-containing protein n=1 Tax=Pseudorhodoplanes sp. TaxID=1934341 RepID=UPI003D13203E
MVEPATAKIAYWHLWADDRGATHQTRCELTSFELQSMGGKAAAQWNDCLLSGEATLLFAVLPVGWIGEWHTNPKPQWISVVSGRWFVESTDGIRVEMGQGDLAFGGDQNAAPDAQGRVGHRSGAIGSEPCALMIVQLDPAVWSGTRPGTFK